MVIEWVRRQGFRASIKSPLFFRAIGRPMLYYLAGQDSESAHKIALETIRRYIDIVEKVKNDFYFDRLKINIAGREVMPFGTAAGLDKDVEALGPLSYLFGFQEPGTVTVKEREGNKKPNVIVDKEREVIFNAQGFPSKGKEHFIDNLRKYREFGGRGVVLASVCGIPENDDITSAYSELEELVRDISPYVDGFVWNPSSPNTLALRALRQIEIFRKSAEIVSRYAKDKLKLVKMGPYDDDLKNKKEWLNLCYAWFEGGGDGIEAVDTLEVGHSFIPSKEWGYQTAGVSGKVLQAYRQRAINETRKVFPRSFIIAVGGIDSGFEAWRALEAGSNAISGYTPYTFHGFGLIREIARYVELQLDFRGYETLRDFQKDKGVTQ